MGTKIVLLGTGTCQIQAHRTAASVMIEWEKGRLVFDFGRGTCRRLLELGLKNDDIEHVYFSHYHPDHVSDLIPFLHAGCWSQIDPRTRDLHLYGPPGLKEQMDRLLSLFPPGNLGCDRYGIRLHEVQSGSFMIAGREFSLHPLPHAGNHGLKFSQDGKTVALTGDTNFSSEEVEFLEGTDLAVIDAGHPTHEEIIELAVQTQTKLLVCSHLYREPDEDALNEAAGKKGYEGRIVVGHDLQEFNL